MQAGILKLQSNENTPSGRGQKGDALGKWIFTYYVFFAFGNGYAPGGFHHCFAFHHSGRTVMKVDGTPTPKSPICFGIPPPPPRSPTFFMAGAVFVPPPPLPAIITKTDHGTPLLAESIHYLQHDAIKTSALIYRDCKYVQIIIHIDSMSDQGQTHYQHDQ